MSYLALYRKYRPTNFNDLVGQNEVSEIIKNEILNNKLSHAYLFSGPRGTGKTSTAKIIAKMINCLHLNDDGSPCDCCENCTNINSNDIVEIDAASNNGVDEIRDLRDKVNLVPTSGRYKIYIIDEVHMLTTQAFNALLKTLEEPPSHAVFILATTEFYKIPATVVSRCQKFQFLKFSNNEIVNRLAKIAALENISVENDILYEIARLSDGGLRDAINMLDQLSSFRDGKIIIDDVYKLNGVVSYLELADLLVFIHRKDVNSIISFVDDIDKKGKNIDKFINDLIVFLKDILIYKNISKIEANVEGKKEKIAEISNFYSINDIYDMIVSLNDLANNLKKSGFSIILLVSYFIKIANNFSEEPKKNPIENSQIKDNKKLENNMEFTISKKSRCDFDNRLKKIRINNAFSTASKISKDKFVNRWGEVEENANKAKYKSIIGIINDIEVLVVGDNNVSFLVKYDSLLERIYDYLEDFENLLLETYNNKYKVVFLAYDEWIYEKEKYIENIKNGNIYEYIEEIDNKKDAVSRDIDDANDKSDIDKIISILGNDVILYK